MKIETIDAPSIPKPANTSATNTTLTARDRAIAQLMKGAEQPTPVQNATQVAPEEMSALRAPSRQPARQQGNVESSEAPVEQAEDTAAPETPLSSQYATLARKEKALRQREQQLRAKELAIREQEAKRQAEPAKPAFDESKYIPKDRLAQDPFAVLAESGLSYEQLVEMAVNAPKTEQVQLMNTIKSLQDEIKSLRGETESNTKKFFEEQQQLQYKQAVQEIRREAKDLIATDPAYETVRATQSLDDVVELIERTYNEDGILLSVDEAARQVEDYLVEEALRLTKLKKIQQKLAPAPQTQQTPQSKQQQPKTLTNSMTSSRQLSARERAILAMEGKLNK